MSFIYVLIGTSAVVWLIIFGFIVREVRRSRRYGFINGLISEFAEMFYNFFDELRTEKIKHVVMENRYITCRGYDGRYLSKDKSILPILCIFIGFMITYLFAILIAAIVAVWVSGAIYLGIEFLIGVLVCLAVFALTWTFIFLYKRLLILKVNRINREISND